MSGASVQFLIEERRRLKEENQRLKKELNLALLKLKQNEPASVEPDVPSAPDSIGSGASNTTISFKFKDVASVVEFVLALPRLVGEDSPWTLTITPIPQEGYYAVNVTDASGGISHQSG